MGRQKMGLYGVGCSRLICASILIALLTTKETQSATTIKDILNLNTQTLQRVPRDNKYYLSRYGSGQGADEAGVGGGSRTIKPEDSPEARQGEPGAVEKRCSHCGEYDRYDSRSRYYDDRYETRRSRYPDYDYDRYDTKDRGYDRYDRYDRYDQGKDRGYDRYDSRERYPDYNRDRYYDRYDSRDRLGGERDRYGGDRDRYGGDRDRYGSERDRYGGDRDRGIGYDNRGYDYKGSDRGYDRGYGGRPDYYGTSYASSWNYGNRGDDYYKDRGGYRDQGYGGGGGYRSRDPYLYDTGYRGTSYLYGRPSSTTTPRPSSQDDNSVTDSPQQTNSPSGADSNPRFPGHRILFVV